MMQTGENEQGLKKILDFTRLGSIALLLFHFYFYCYGAFQKWELTAPIGDRLLENMSSTGLFRSSFYSKGLSLALLFISLLGARGKKSEAVQKRQIIRYLLAGAILYFGSCFILRVQGDPGAITASY